MFYRATEEESNKTTSSSPNPADNEEAGQEEGDQQVEQSTTRYNIEFTFDSDVRCAITVYYFATEEVVNKQLV